MAQAISKIAMRPTPVSMRKVAITEPVIDKAPTPAAAAAEPTTLAQVAAAPTNEDTSTAKKHPWRQIAPPAGRRASREYQTSVLEPTIIAAAKVAIALTMANGSNISLRPT